MDVSAPDRSRNPARLLVADDHALVREGIRTMLAGEPDLEVVAEAEDGIEALSLCRRLCPDLVLMDVRMPRMDGLEATRAVKGVCPKTSVLVLTSHESPDYLLEAVRAGAAGYVLKEATKPQLLSAVHRVLSGESALNQELAMLLLRRVADEVGARSKRRAEEPATAATTTRSLPKPPAAPLSGKELDVVRLLALGKTNRQIAEELMVSLSSVKTYVGRMMNKLGVSDRTQAAVRAVELGLLRERG